MLKLFFLKKNKFSILQFIYFFSFLNDAVFRYDNTKHNVFKLNGALFSNCTFPAGTTSWASGNDVVPLTTPGRKWYACGRDNHCAERSMKLAITVLSNGPSAAPAPPPPSSHALPSSPSFAPLMAAFLALAPFIFA